MSETAALDAGNKEGIMGLLGHATIIEQNLILPTCFFSPYLDLWNPKLVF